MAYAERRNGKLTGKWIGEVRLTRNGTEITYRRRFDTKKDAEGYEAYVRATGEDMPRNADAVQSDTLAAVAEAWKRRNLKWFNQQHTGRFEYVVDHLGKYPIAAVTTTVLDSFVDKLFARGQANRTVLRYLDCVSLILNYAHERGMLPKGKPTIPRPANEGKKRQALTEEQERAIRQWLLDHGHADIEFIVRVLLATGMRTGELWKLTPEQIETEGWWLKAEQTKTDDPRWVSLHPVACSKLRGMIENKALPKQTHVAYVFKQAAKAAGDWKDLCLYCLRHTRVTRLINSGANVLQVAESVGHKSLSTTKGYFHPAKERIAEVAQKVPGEWGDLEPKDNVVEFKKQANQ